eukprot:TRINITY_DN3604_c0_g1_i1.p1 TRINITY_DN3604_c0_g1~~TRINITY_DN3604_c0_g1_i1.p1  ORF type:complete len:267 (+),score=106.51 TRINITY_DN3604_c0_g1_i1:18-818(+)
MALNVTKDLFANQARLYAVFRPKYTPSFLSKITSFHSPATHLNSPPKSARLAVDIATGTGFVASFLSNHFDKVIGIDQSQKQLDNAAKADNIEYRLGDAFNTNLPAASVSLITIAQAIHWFGDRVPEFYQECDRVLEDQGALAVLGYSTPFLSDPKLDSLFKEFYLSTKSLWECDRTMIDTKYRDLPLPPYAKVQRIEENLSKMMKVADFVGYCETWSAYQVLLQSVAKGGPEDIFEDFYQRLTAVVGDGEFEVNWPMFAILSQKA